MSEEEWLAAGDPATLVNAMRGKRDRKLRLLFCACARTVWDMLDQPLYRTAVEIGERLADGLADPAEVAAVRDDLCPGPHFTGPAVGQAAYWAVADGFPVWVLWNIADLHAARAAGQARRAGRSSLPRGAFRRFRRDLADLGREVLGNPFRPFTFDPQWRTADVVGLARGIYEDRAFDRLPLLADALMDAGCAEEQLLAHCRSDGPHVRGCWVVDLVLDKE
jgi:hypothetical protein